MKITAYKINAFAKTINGGNEAGIVLKADHFNEDQMKKIAANLGFSETAFVMKSDAADFKVRFFTPVQEVDLCGHATIGTFSALAILNHVKPEKYTQETLAGLLTVEINDDLSVMMQQPIPLYGEIIDKKEIADSLNITLNDLSAELPVQIVSTGLKDIIIPINKMEILDGIHPNFNKIEEISRRYDAVGYHVFSLKTQDQVNASCRNFAPLCGIPEESATGTSNGALACYLYKYGKISDEQIGKILIQQGFSMNKLSEIIASLGVKDKEVIEVKVGGKSLNLSEITIEI